MMRELQNLEDMFQNLIDSGSEEDYDAVIEELNDLEVYASRLLHVIEDDEYEEELDEQ